MSSIGPLALLGGGEHRPTSEAGDRRLLELTGAPAPLVTVIPSASSRRQFPHTAALAHDHWRRLGTSVAIIGPETSNAESLDLIDSADVIVLPGGHPDLLMRRLGKSTMRHHIAHRWSTGAALAGSSAGAMCLFRHRLRLYPPNPFALEPGLGVLDGFIAAPHFDRFRARQWARWACRFLHERPVLGIDEDTSIVGHVDSLRVFGLGAAVITSQRTIEEYPGGFGLPIELGTAMPRIDMATTRSRVAGSRHEALASVQTT